MSALADSQTIDRDSARGMLLMTGAAVVVPGMDAMAKLLGATLSPFQVGFLRYAIQTGLLLVLFAALRRPLLTAECRAALPRLALAGLFISIAAGALFWSFRHLPLANAIAIFFVEPLVLTMFSAWFLGERVGWHRRCAVLVGLGGALVVIRPNVALFGWATLLPLVAATAFAGLAVTMRSATARLDGLRAQAVSGGFAALILGAVVAAGTLAGVPLLAFAEVSREAMVLLMVLGVFATLVQLMMTLAFKYTETSLLAPLQYLEIVGATTLGYVIFGDFPDALTWVGTAIILAAGFYVIHRERRLARARLTVLPAP